MKNILIITIGTRDIQTTKQLLNQAVTDGVINQMSPLTISVAESQEVMEIKPNPGFAGYFLFSKPRREGRIIAQTPARQLTWLSFPLIEGPLQWLAQENLTIQQVLLVYTDQEGQGVAPYHLDNDTLHFSTVMESYLRQHPLTQQADFDEYCISQEVTNIDEQYLHFEAKKREFLDTPAAEINSVFLLAQGGIDQINMGLTLRLIEHFPGKVRYLHKAEEAKTTERTFPTLFIKNLTKAKAIPPLDRYEFATVKAIVDDPALKSLAQVGVAVKSLQVDELKLALTDLFKTGYISPELMALKDRIGKQTDDLTKQELLFCNVLVELEQQEYNDALWRLRTLGEVLLAPDIKDFLSLNNLTDSTVFTEAIKQKPDLEQHLIHKGVALKKNLWEANAFVLRCLFDYRYPKKSWPKALNKAARVLEAIGEIRNQLVHTAKPVSRTDIETALTKQGQTLKSVEDCLRSYFDSVNINITGFGIYDTIHNEIHALL